MRSTVFRSSSLTWGDLGKESFRSFRILDSFLSQCLSFSSSHGLILVGTAVSLAVITYRDKKLSILLWLPPCDLVLL